jgi:hypothetical protein
MEMKSRLFDRVIFGVGIEYQVFYHDVNGNVLLVRFTFLVPIFLILVATQLVYIIQSVKLIKSSTSFRYA